MFLFYHLEVGHPRREAVVIGSGPNGLAAAITLARAGLRVTVHEASEQIGGGTRSAELTLPGYLHDVCSAVHPLAVCSPFFRDIPLGVEWIHPEAPLAHPLDDGTAVMLERSIDATCAGLGADGSRWRRLVGPLVAKWPALIGDVLALPRLPRDPLAAVRFGIDALRPAMSLARAKFRGERARVLFAGLAAHSILPLEMRPSSAAGLVLAAAAHAAGWPIPRGGSQRIADGLAAHLRALGGTIRTASPVVELPESDLVMCDLTPRQFIKLACDRLPPAYAWKLARYRYGPGAFKLDWALDGPIPWRAAECRRAATVHLGGSADEIAASERAAWYGHHPARPFVLLAQPSLFDPERAPAGHHTAWAYCHVPNGSSVDMTEAIEEQVERFAPGFRKRILARHAMGPAALERRNPNLVGGDINGGAATLRQLFIRPGPRTYSTPIPGVYLCSASTPPGGGVHGMCGYLAARRALLELP